MTINSNTQVCFWSGSIDPNDIQRKDAQVGEKVHQLLAGRLNGLNLEKLQGHDLYSIRVSRKKRLIVGTVVLDNKRYLNLIKFLPNHEYKKLDSLSPAVLAHYKEKALEALQNQPTPEELKWNKQEEGSVNLPFMQEGADRDFSLQRVEFLGHRFIKLTDDQIRALSATGPQVIHGGPGAGKSSVILTKLSDLVAHYQKDASNEEKRLLCLAEGRLLRHDMQTNWQNSPASQQLGKIQVNFYSFKDLIQEIDPSLKDKVEVKEEHFISWYKKNHAGLNLKTFPPSHVYQELPMVELLGEEEYADLGNKKSLFSDVSREDKERLYALLKDYKTELVKNGQYDLRIYSLPEDTKPIFDWGGIDESQDLSVNQKEVIRQLVKEPFFARDSHQNIAGFLSDWPIMKKMLGGRIKPINLTNTHRCPNTHLKFTNVFLRLAGNATQGTAEEGEYAAMQLPPEGKDGKIFWPKDLAKLKSTFEALRKTYNTTEIIVGVGNHQMKPKAKELFGDDISVLTPEQIKGLENKCVFLFNPLNPTILREMNQQLEDIESFSAIKIRPNRPKKNQSRFWLRPALNATHVLLTRSNTTLVFFQESDHRLKNVLRLMEEGAQELITTIKTEQQDTEQARATDQEILEQAKRLILNETTFDEAQALYAQLEHPEMSFDAFAESILSPRKTEEKTQKMAEKTLTPSPAPHKAPEEELKTFIQSRFSVEELQEHLRNDEWAHRFFNNKCFGGKSAFDWLLDNKKKRKFLANALLRDDFLAYSKIKEILTKTQAIGITSILVGSSVRSVAKFALGALFSTPGDLLDQKAASKWYEKAASQGHPHAQEEIGLRYKKGIGVKQDYKLAFDWLAKAADDHKRPLAQYHLGNLWVSNPGDYPPDHDQACSWWQMAAEQGLTSAQQALEIAEKYQKAKTATEIFELGKECITAGNPDFSRYLLLQAKERGSQDARNYLKHNDYLLGFLSDSKFSPANLKTLFYKSVWFERIITLKLIDSGLSVFETILKDEEKSKILSDFHRDNWKEINTKLESKYSKILRFFAETYLDKEKRLRSANVPPSKNVIQEVRTLFENYNTQRMQKFCQIQGNFDKLLMVTLPSGRSALDEILLDPHKFSDVKDWLLEFRGGAHRLDIFVHFDPLLSQCIAHLIEIDQLTAKDSEGTQLKAAIDWILTKVDLNESGEFFLVGMLYHIGLGVQRDLKTAKFWYNKSMERFPDDGASLNALCTIYMSEQRPDLVLTLLTKHLPKHEQAKRLTELLKWNNFSKDNLRRTLKDETLRAPFFNTKLHSGCSAFEEIMQDPCKSFITNEFFAHDTSFLFEVKKQLTPKHKELIQDFQIAFGSHREAVMRAKHPNRPTDPTPLMMLHKQAHPNNYNGDLSHVNALNDYYKNTINSLTDASQDANQELIKGSCAQLGIGMKKNIKEAIKHYLNAFYTPKTPQQAIDRLVKMLNSDDAELASQELKALFSINPLYNTLPAFEPVREAMEKLQSRD